MMALYELDKEAFAFIKEIFLTSWARTNYISDGDVVITYTETNANLSRKVLKLRKTS
jgi:hypothetical protein